MEFWEDMDTLHHKKVSKDHRSFASTQSIGRVILIDLLLILNCRNSLQERTEGKLGTSYALDCGSGYWTHI